MHAAVISGLPRTATRARLPDLDHQASGVHAPAAHMIIYSYSYAAATRPSGEVAGTLGQLVGVSGAGASTPLSAPPMLGPSAPPFLGVDVSCFRVATRTLAKSLQL